MCKRGVLREGVLKDTQQKYEYTYIYEKKEDEDFLSAVIKVHAGQPV